MRHQYESQSRRTPRHAIPFTPFALLPASTASRHHGTPARHVHRAMRLCPLGRWNRARTVTCRRASHPACPDAPLPNLPNHTVDSRPHACLAAATWCDARLTRYVMPVQPLLGPFTLARVCEKPPARPLCGLSV